MNLSNFTDTFVQQVNNPDCSFLSGMFMGNLLSIRLVIVYIIIGVILATAGGFVTLFFDWLRMKLKITKKR